MTIGFSPQQTKIENGSTWLFPTPDAHLELTLRKNLEVVDTVYPL